MFLTSASAAALPEAARLLFLINAINEIDLAAVALNVGLCWIQLESGVKTEL